MHTLESYFAPRKALNNEYMKVKSLAIDAALPFSSASYSMITEQSTGDRYPFINKINVTIASVSKSTVVSKLENEGTRTIVNANIGERMERDNSSSLIVFGCTDYDDDDWGRSKVGKTNCPGKL